MIRPLTTLAIAALVAAAAGAQPQPLAAQEPDSAASREQAAQRAAEAWFVLFDGGKYEESWKAAGKMFQQQVSAELWTQQGGAVAAQLGAFQKRELQSAQYRTELPNVPPGDYMVLTYSSAFANLPNARELAILMLEDGAWKIIGYFVQPQGD